MSEMKLWWASVGGNPCEPIRVGIENGEEVFYSIGCGDPHPMTGVVLVKESDAPLSPAETEKERLRRQAEFDASIKAGRGCAYRRF